MVIHIHWIIVHMGGTFMTIHNARPFFSNPPSIFVRTGATSRVNGHRADHVCFWVDLTMVAIHLGATTLAIVTVAMIVQTHIFKRFDDDDDDDCCGCVLTDAIILVHCKITLALRSKNGSSFRWCHPTVGFKHPPLPYQHGYLLLYLKEQILLH